MGSVAAYFAAIRKQNVSELRKNFRKLKEMFESISIGDKRWRLRVVNLNTKLNTFCGLPCSY